MPSWIAQSDIQGLQADCCSRRPFDSAERRRCGTDSDAPPTRAAAARSNLLGAPTGLLMLASIEGETMRRIAYPGHSQLRAMPS